MNGPQFLELLENRRSVRRFSDRRVEREVLERLVRAAVTAPSNSNRQPWRFAVVTGVALRAEIAAAVRLRTEEIQAIIARGHHAEDYGAYGDFFYEPLEAAQALIVPQYREHPDLIANLIASGGGDPAAYHTARSMQAELCSTSAANMALLLQARAEGLGACWMAGPMVAMPEICERLKIRPPWKMVGAIALGYPEEEPQPQPRKPLGRVAQFFE